MWKSPDMCGTLGEPNENGVYVGKWTSFHWKKCECDGYWHRVWEIDGLEQESTICINSTLENGEIANMDNILHGIHICHQLMAIDGAEHVKLCVGDGNDPGHAKVLFFACKCVKIHQIREKLDGLATFWQYYNDLRANHTRRFKIYINW